MRENKRKADALTQILVAVVVALIAGGTSPWWWTKVFDDTGKKAAEVAPAQEPIATSPPSTITKDVQTQPASDFPGGSRRIYSADFLQWPIVNIADGSATPESGEYVIRPSGDAWMGEGREIDIQQLREDFVFDVHYRVEERNPSSSLQIELIGPGPDADYVSMFLDVWDQGNVTYSLDKGWIRNHYLTRDRQIADRQLLPANLKDNDWSKGAKITLKREAGKAQFFVNDGYITDFPVSRFPVAQVYVAAAFRSKVVITSIEGRKP